MTDLARLQVLLAQQFPNAKVREIGDAARSILRELKVTP